MSENHADKGDTDSRAVALAVEPAFVLLFSIHLKGTFKGFGCWRRFRIDHLEVVVPV